MRTVVPIHRVYELWAAQSQRTARNGQGNAWFEDETAYSSSARIGRIVENERGERAALITNRTWSHTTSAHTGAAWSAAQGAGLPIFRVPDLSSETWDRHDRNLVDYEFRIDVLNGKVARARSRREWHERDLSELTAEASRYVQFFGLGETFHGGLVAELAAKREAEEAAHWAVEIERWRSGEREAPLYGYPLALLRVRRDGELYAGGPYVETSLGGYAYLAWEVRPLWEAYIAGTLPESFTDYRVVLDAKDGLLHVGCNTIPVEEIDRVARELGWDRSEVERHAPAQVA